MYKFFFFFLSVGAAIASPSTPVKKCRGLEEDFFKEVVVTTPRGVCTKLPCDLLSGSEVKTDILFKVRSEVSQIVLKCNATALGTTIEYPIPNADKGCDMLTNAKCPVKAGTEANLRFIMKVSKIFPKIPVNLVIYMVDQSRKMISCFEVPTRVVEGN